MGVPPDAVSLIRAPPSTPPPLPHSRRSARSPGLVDFDRHEMPGENPRFKTLGQVQLHPDGYMMFYHKTIEKLPATGDAGYRRWPIEMVTAPLSDMQGVNMLLRRLGIPEFGERLAQLGVHVLRRQLLCVRVQLLLLGAADGPGRRDLHKAVDGDEGGLRARVSCHGRQDSPGGPRAGFKRHARRGARHAPGRWDAGI